MLTGRVTTNWEPDGLRMQIVEAFTFTDAAGRVWEVPAGFVTDAGTGTVVFTPTCPVPTLTIGGVSLMFDAAGVIGGVPYIDYCGSGSLCTMGTPTGCGTNLFRVRITCGCCPATTTITTPGATTFVATCDWVDVELWGDGSNFAP